MADSSIQNKDKTCRKRGLQKGYVTVEYAIVTAGVIVALILPIPGAGVSMIDLVLEAIASFQAHSSMMLALP